jgi:hypothetical protein
MQNLFTAEIELVEDQDEGLRVECVEPHLKPISRALSAAGFNLGSAVLKIPGTANLPSVMELPVADGYFDSMKAAIYESLIAAKVDVTEEDFSALGEKRIRFNLNNVSIYGN